MLNILDLNAGAIMLGNDVLTYQQAYYWLDYYRYHYGEGVPFHNGQGTYAGDFIIVRQVEGTDVYRAIQ